METSFMWRGLMAGIEVVMLVKWNSIEVQAER
jgi:hypothetical protein